MSTAVPSTLASEVHIRQAGNPKRTRHVRCTKCNSGWQPVSTSALGAQRLALGYITATPLPRAHKLRHRHQLQVLAPPAAPAAAAPLGTDAGIQVQVDDVTGYTFAEASEALEESLEQVKILTVLIDSLENRLQAQVAATKDIYAWGMSEDFTTRITNHIEHLRTQLGAAQSQLSVATARIDALEEIAERERDTVVHIETMARNLNWNVPGLRDIPTLADKWQVAVASEPAVRALARDATEKSTKLAELDRLRRIVEAELSDAKLTLAICKHRLAAVENRPAMVPVAEAAVERAVEAVEAKAEEYEEVVENVKEAKKIAMEATSAYNREVRQLRWNLQAAVQIARDEYDIVGDELQALRDEMNAIVQATVEAEEAEADLYAEKERLERQLEMNELAKQEMEAKKRERMDKRNSENWRDAFDEVVTASMEEERASSSEDEDDYGEPAPVGNWRQALKRMQGRPSTPGGAGSGPQQQPPHPAAGASAAAQTLRIDPDVGPSGPQSSSTEAAYRPAQASVPLLDSAIRQQSPDADARGTITGHSSSETETSLPAEILAQVDAIRREGAIIPPQAGSKAAQGASRGSHTAGPPTHPVPEAASHTGQDTAATEPAPDYLEAARQALLKKAGLKLQGRVGGVEVSTEAPSLTVRTPRATDKPENNPFGPDGPPDLASDFEAHAAEQEAGIFDTLDLEDSEVHLNEEFQHRLQDLQHRAEEQEYGRPEPRSLPEMGQGPWPLPTVPAGSPPGTLLLYAAAQSLPHPDKRHKGGEDAFFISNVGCGAIGVADGVGGWIEDGIDPGDFSRNLMQRVCEALEGSGPEGDPVELLQYAQDTTHHAGSSTACVAVLHPDGLLRVANLGDSGLKVIRNGEVLFATQTQQHAFNMPFQLANPDLLPDTDTAQDADYYEVPVEHNDIVILATDGLYDNLWDEQLLQVVKHASESDNPSTRLAQDLATTLADLSHDNAIDESFRSPWAVDAAAAGVLPVLDSMLPRGGKLDDCTVVVGIVQTP